MGMNHHGYYMMWVYHNIQNYKHEHNGVFFLFCAFLSNGKWQNMYEMAHEKSIL